MFFIVVNGVPSNASWIMVGDGIIGQHTLKPRSTLPRSTISAQLVAQYGGSFVVTGSGSTSGGIRRRSTSTIMSVSTIILGISAIVGRTIY